MAKCACGKHEISDEQAVDQAARAHKQREDTAARIGGAAADGCGCGCKGAGQSGLGLRAASAQPGARPADQSHGRRQLGLRGL